MKLSILAAVLVWTVTISEVFAGYTYTVGIISDGENPKLFEAQTLLIDEIQKASEGEFTVRFPESKRYNGNFSVERIRSSIEKFQKDSDIDFVLLIGSTASQIALTRPAFAKPTFAPFVYNVSLSGVQKHNRFSMHNLNYVTTETQLNEEIRKFQKLVSFKKIGIVLEESQYRLFATAANKAVTEAKKQGIELIFIPVNERDKDITDKIPVDLNALMLTSLSSVDTRVRKQWIKTINDRKLPTYALGDGTMIYEGALASSVEKDDLSRRARRTALNMLAVMRGKKVEEQPVLIEQKRQLMINMQTAPAIGVYPKFSVLDNAILFNETAAEKEPKLSLTTIAKEAIRANLSIIGAKLGVAANKENIAEVRSVLFPQITGEAEYSQQNSDNVYVENGFYAEKSVSGRIKLQQILFSEKALANLEIQKELQVAIDEQQRSLEIEVVKQAMTAFLNVLIAQTHYRIQQDNLTLTQTNLELAKGRVQAGSSDMSDVYYWESAIATARQNVLNARADVEKGKDGLNLILNRKISERFITEPATLDTPVILNNKKVLSELITDQRSFDAMASFFISEGIDNIPQLHQINAQMRAQKRQLLSDERSYWSPDIIFGADVSHIFDETRNPGAGINMKNETDWQAGVRLSLPLYEGGARKARGTRTQLKLQQLEVNYIDQLRKTEQQIRSDLHMLKASYSSIDLSEEAALTAKKSFNMVRENYAKGTRTMSDLLSAQNTSLIADRESANTTYRFMMDLLQLQQDIGSFNLFVEDSEREKLIKRLELYIVNK